MAVRHRDGRITSLICTIASGAPSADRTTARRSRWSALNWCAVRLKNCRWRARTGSLKVAVRSSLTERRTFVFESGISSTDGRGSSGQRTTPPNVHFAGCRLAGGLGCFVDLTTTASARPSSMRESRPPRLVDVEPRACLTDVLASVADSHLSGKRIVETRLGRRGPGFLLCNGDLTFERGSLRRLGGRGKLKISRGSNLRPVAP